MNVFDILSPDGHPIYVASLANDRGKGPVHHEYVASNEELAAFIQRYDHPGRALYYTVARLRPGAARCKEAVASTHWIWAEIDHKDHPTLAPEEILRRVTTTPLPPSLVILSGHGVHLLWQLREPEDASPEEGQRRIEDALRLVCAYVGGDPNVAETSRLLRLPSSHNSRVPGENLLVRIEVADKKRVYDLNELVDFWLEAHPVLPPPEQPAGSAQSRDAERGSAGPVDVEDRLAAMRFKGPGDSGVHLTQLSVTGSLTRAGWRVEDTTEYVLRATRAAVANDPRCADWDWDKERIAIAHMCFDLVNKTMRLDGEDLSHVLPDNLYRDWQAVLQRGDRPYICGNGKRKAHVRGWGGNGHDKPSSGTGEAREEPTSETKSQAKCETLPPKAHRFKLVPFGEMRPGPEPLYLVDELVPIAGLVDIWGKSKCFKSFWVLDLCLHVVMGWEYRDRRVRQGSVVYCAFEGGHGYKKRIEGLRRHYRIADDASVPLYVMPGQANLISDHRLLISDIRDQLGATSPAVVVLDTLNKSLVGSESKDADMGNYVRAAEAIRDAFGCVVIIVHHCGLDETRPRGHTSLPGAVDAQLAVVREGMAVTITVEFMRDGPEDTVVTSVFESIEVGEDDAGKTLTTLVAVPGDGPGAVATGARWSRALRVFHRALTDSLAAHGEIIRELADAYSPQVRAVDRERVREVFYSTYPADGTTEEQRQENRRRQFNRNVTQAQAANLIRVRVLPTGATMIWPSAGTT
jgi:hypothetical protein